MASSIRVSDETKRLLDERKRENETYDELLRRLAKNDSTGDLAGFGRWSDETAERARESVKRSRESFER